MNTKKLVTLSLLTTIALIIFTVEAQLPPVVPIPGVKIGLANAITLITMVWFGRKEAFAVLMVRIFLGSIFAGAVSGLIYSLAGGILCFFVTAVLIKIFDIKQLWVVSVFGALSHNLGQLVAAAFITSTPQIFGYFPILAVSAVITGAFTGILAYFVVKRGRFDF